MRSIKDSFGDSFGDSLTGSLRGSVAGSFAVLLSWSLCLPASAAVLSSSPSADAAAKPQPSRPQVSRPAYKSSQLQGDERILHALNRFTFGPRSGDLNAIRAMGLEKWFDRQLHPASIDEVELKARLAQFPAMQLNPQDLIYRLPSNAVIRQATNGKIPVPAEGVLRAIYENQINRLQVKKEEKADKTAIQDNSPQTGMNGQGTNASMTSASGGMSAPAAASPAAPMPDKSALDLAARMDILDEPAPDPNEFQNLLALAPQQRLGELAALLPGEFDNFLKSLKGPQRLQLVADMAPEQREIAAALENPQRTVSDELLAERLTRDIYSNAQVEEVMTDFWLNHFNIYAQKDEQMPYYLVSYERDVIRPLALGKFEDLLEAVAHSPAMLLYLDNSSSMGPDSLAAERAKMAADRNPSKAKPAPEGLNENYARELMELHTLGVNGGYTQADVTQVARVLTGWTVDQPQRGGAFQFNPNRHEPGTKKVLGEKINESGELEGRELLHMLASRPATAQFISRELAIRFVSDNPPQSLVDRMAKAYLASGGDIPTVLKMLFHSPEFWAASDARAKVKTPLEFVISAVRSSNADVKMYQPLVQALRQMGMPLYGCIPPTGYNWEESTWVSTGALVDRMNFALSLSGNKLQGITVNWTSQSSNGQSNDTMYDSSAMPSPELPSPESEEARLEPLLVAGGVSVSTRSAALEQFQAQMGQSNPQAKPVAATRPANRANVLSQTEKEDELLAGLLIGSPEFQRR